MSLMEERARDMRLYLLIKRLINLEMEEAVRETETVREREKERHSLMVVSFEFLKSKSRAIGAFRHR